MKQLLVLTLALGSFTSMATATTVNFYAGETPDQGNGQAPVRTWIETGFTVTVRAFSFANGTYSPAQSTQFGVNNIGLGVCSAGENCTFNEWQIDNIGANDGLLFTFSVPVTIGSVLLTQTTITADSDAVWFVANGALTAPSPSWVLNAANGPVLSPGQDRTVNINTTGQTFFFGTPAGEDDSWKLVSLTANVATAPEPGSLALVGLGLAGLGFLKRTRKG